MLRSIGKQSGESVESVLEFRGVSTAAAARHHYFAPNTAAEYCDKRVCLSVCLCLFLRLFRTARPIFTNFYAC